MKLDIKLLFRAVKVLLSIYFDGTDLPVSCIRQSSSSEQYITFKIAFIKPALAIELSGPTQKAFLKPSLPIELPGATQECFLPMGPKSPSLYYC